METSKEVTPCDSSFEDEVRVYLQEGMSNDETESECARESDHNTKCVAE
jgi:hypothetical protein